MEKDFYTIRERSMFPRGWGDYGYILQHGMTAHLGRVDGRLALERTGPFIPPVTLPGIGDVVVTRDARKKLESSGLSGFTFQDVEKVLVVELHWEQWDLNAEEPATLPDSGEPEDYILGQAHSPNAAAQLGELWEVVSTPTVRIIRPSAIVKSHYELRIDLSTWNGGDLFRSSDYGGLLVTRRGRDWFSDVLGSWVRFDPFPAG